MSKITPDQLKIGDAIIAKFGNDKTGFKEGVFLFRYSQTEPKSLGPKKMRDGGRIVDVDVHKCICLHGEHIGQEFDLCAMPDLIPGSSLSIMVVGDRGIIETLNYFDTVDLKW